MADLGREKGISRSTREYAKGFASYEDVWNEII